jgi:hypothetical protein
MRVTLPFGCRRAERRSFGATIMLLLLVVLACGIRSWTSFIGGAAVIVSVAALTLWFPRLLEWPYRAWNKAARLYASWATRCVTAVCFYVIVCAVGFATSASRRATSMPSVSAWRPHRALPPDSYESQYELADSAGTGAGWNRAFISWCRRTDNAWALSLLPFLVVLGWLHAESSGPQPADIYTLF